MEELVIKDSNNNVMLTSAGYQLFFNQKITYSFVTELDNDSNGYNFISEENSQPVMYTYFTLIRYTPNANIFPFIKFNGETRYVTILDIIITNSKLIDNPYATVQIQLLAHKAFTEDKEPTLYVFTDYKSLVNKNDNEYGMEIKDSDNNIKYSTNYVPLNIHETVDVTISNRCREGSKGSGKSANLNPDTENQFPIDTDTWLNKYMYYCPIHSYGAEVYTHEESRTTCTGLDYFGVCMGTKTAYAYGGLWYAYYKGAFKPHHGFIKTSYSLYTYLQTERSASTTSWSVAGIEKLWGGAPSVDAMGISGSFINTTANVNNEYTVLIADSEEYGDDNNFFRFPDEYVVDLLLTFFAMLFSSSPVANIYKYKYDNPDDYPPY